MATGRCPFNGVLLSIWLTYAATLGPEFDEFVFDDTLCINRNLTLSKFDPVWNKAAPNVPIGLWRRPVASWTLTIDYQLFGLDAQAFRRTNIAIHTVAAFTLFFLISDVLRTQDRESAVGRFWLEISLSASVLWALHPLQTESVTYIIQRIEALMGLFFFLMLLGLVRGSQSPGPRRAGWYLTSIAACWLGMLSKEVMIVAPFAALLVDWTLLSRSLRELVRARWLLYVLYGTAALFLVAMVAAPVPDSVVDPPELRREVSRSSYFMTQAAVITEYLRLTFWPSGLCFDRNFPIAQHLAEVIIRGSCLVAVLVYGIWLLVRRKPVGLLITLFFLVLAPTSSVMPIGTVYFEHRMYVPLAFVVLLLLVITAQGISRLAEGRRPRLLFLFVTAIPAICLAVATNQRNLVYQSEEALYRDSIAKDSRSWRSMENMAVLHFRNGRPEKAIALLKRAVEIEPRNVKAYFKLARILTELNRPDEAIDAIEPINGEYPSEQGLVCHQLAMAWEQKSNWARAQAFYEEAVKGNPEAPQIWVDYAVAVTKRGDLDSADKYLRIALRLDPLHVEANLNSGVLVMITGRSPEKAISFFQTALQRDPNNKTAVEYIRRAQGATE